jgi:GntR family transcriptional regulator
MPQQPIYVQIQNSLVARIESGDLPEGSMLPGELDLAAQFGVSRPTVRQAILELARQGLVARARGRGTIVVGRRREYPARRLVSFSEENAGSGRAVTSKVLSSGLVVADPQLADQFGLPGGGQVFVLDRLRYVNGQLVAWQKSFLPSQNVPGIQQIDFEGQSLYRVLLERFGLEVDHGEEAISIGGANRQEAHLLEVFVGASVFRIERRSYLPSDRLLELVQSVYRGDQYEIRLRLAR